jgi:hypothetical protein
MNGGAARVALKIALQLVAHTLSAAEDDHECAAPELAENLLQERVLSQMFRVFFKK